MTWKLFALLVVAAGSTAAISVISIAIGIIIGIAVCAAMLSPQTLVRRAGRLYVSFFRGAPLLVQLLLIYHLLPAIGINLPGLACAVIGLSLCTAAYQAENLRGGFASVPSGLIEAADMVGLSRRQSFLRIKVPIAIRLTLPAVVNEATMILKSSSLVSVVGIVELTKMAQDLAASTFRPVELYSTAAVLYLVLNWVLAGLGFAGERMIQWGRA